MELTENLPVPICPRAAGLLAAPRQPTASDAPGAPGGSQRLGSPRVLQLAAEVARSGWRPLHQSHIWVVVREGGQAALPAERAPGEASCGAVVVFFMGSLMYSDRSPGNHSLWGDHG